MAPKGLMTYDTTQTRPESERPARESERQSEGLGGPSEEGGGEEEGNEEM